VEPPIRTAIHDARFMDHVLLRLEAGGGQVGIGHLFAFGQRQAEALRILVDDLAALLVGRRIENPVVLWDQLYRSITFLGRTGAAMMALAAVDGAVWDLWARALDRPLWSVLGGERMPHECYASDSLWLDDPPDVLVRSAAARVESGFRSVKVRIGAADGQDDVRRVASVFDAVGGKASVMADANQGWDRGTALRLTEQLQPYGLRWLEEPVDMEDLDGLRLLTTSFSVPIAGGESWFGPREISRGFEASKLAVLMPDLQRAGGVTGWLRSAHAAEDGGAVVSPHLFPEISAHLMCTLRRPGPIEYVPWFQRLFVDPPRVDAGEMRPGERPGLGLEFRPEFI
jgi:L-alanine-DL-glutamate epimerase-like enolase superfamily enzyme